MKQFVVTAHDKKNSTVVRAANRAAHLAYIADAQKMGVTILLAGPLFENVDCETMAGSHLVLMAQDINVIKDFLAKDPYNQAGLFDRVEVYPFKKVLPAT